LINFNNVLYFTADSGNGQGRELYRSNGTRNGTELVADINPGAASSNPTDFAVVNNVLYFAADNGFNGRELFSNNGTIGNVNLVADLNFGRTDGLADSSIPTDLINVNNVLYFAATSQFDGREVWRYDPLADANTQPAVISNLSDATTGSSPGTDLSALPGSDPAVLENFLADRPNRSAFAAIDNGLYFAATSEVLGRELYRTDGTFASTALVNNINPNGSSDPTGLTNINGVLYFGATASTLFGKELYRFNPSARRPRARLVRVSDINPGEGGSEPTEFVQFRNNLIFVATTPFFGQELRSLPLRA
jgi:ELWxxDGT repeat protein